MYTSRALIAVLAGAICVSARPAHAQHHSNVPTSPAVQVPPVELALTVSVNGLPTDVNASPTCASLSFPCTHGKASSWGGVGIDVTLYGNLSRHTALAGSFAASAHDFDTDTSLAARRPAWNHVRAWLGGLRFTPGFDTPRRKRSQESNRIFVEALLGVETSTLFPARQVVQIDAGADGHGRYLRYGREMTLRLALGYRTPPRGTRVSQGFRFTIGLVFGPHF